VTTDTDHLREADEYQRSIYRRMAPEQRLRQALRMNAMARQLLAAGFQARNPSWTEDEIRRAVRDTILYARTG